MKLRVYLTTIIVCLLLMLTSCASNATNQKTTNSVSHHNNSAIQEQTFDSSGKIDYGKQVKKPSNINKEIGYKDRPYYYEEDLKPTGNHPSVSMKSIQDSTAISSIGYDIETAKLFICFKENGYTYAYSEFPEAEWNEFKNADSLGRYHNNNIRGWYPCERLD